MNWRFFPGEEFGRFLLAGAVNTGLSYALYLLLNLLLHYQLAYGLSYVGGVLLSYWLNNRWVFKTAMRWRTLLSFPLVYVVQYGFGAVLLHVMVELFDMSEWWSPLLVVIASVPITFLMSRFILKGRWRRHGA